MRFAAPGTARSDDDRPPVVSGTAPPPGAAGRISAQSRTHLRPILWLPSAARAVPPDHPYVRRFWTPVIGAGATADLLRLIAAARRRRTIPHPLYLHMLVAEGLAARFQGHVLVRPDVPLLGPRQLRRLPVHVLRLHDRALEELDGA
jgi:hypothetical protein